LVKAEVIIFMCRDVEDVEESSTSCRLALCTFEATPEEKKRTIFIILDRR
jgi:hypothetical protein